MWEEKLLVLLCEQLGAGGACGLNTSPTLGSSEVDQGTGMCVCLESRSGFFGGVVVMEGGWEFVDAHHMGSCGLRASVGV